MIMIAFTLLSLIWLADMALLAAIGPIGKQPFISAVLYILGHALMLILVWRFPSNLSSNKAYTLIMCLGILARLIFLPYPISNDVFRYVWEGYIQNLGFNPYSYPPNHSALAEIAQGKLHPVWQQINHPELSAAYPPFTLLIFRGLACVNPSPLFFKVAMIGFDIGVMIILMLIINDMYMPPSRLLLYAVNPLVILFIAGEGHVDIIQVFFLCLALYLILCKNYEITGFVSLGLAILAKYFALVALPFLVNAENRWKSIAVFFPFLLYIPFMDAGTNLFTSLGLFAAEFHYNDSVAVLLRYLLGDQAHLISLPIILLCLVWVYLIVQNQLRSIYVATGCFLLFFPTLHPWYLVLIVPFLVFYPSKAWMYLTAAVVFTFPVMAAEFETGIFQELFWAKIFEYIPFCGLLVWGLFRDGYLFRNKPYTRPQRISAIIPTLNESKSLERCLQNLNDRTALTEIIVADGGSTDETKSIAKRYGARVVECERGRGFQIKKGIEFASGDVIVTLHADCVAKKGVFNRILRTLEPDPHVVGGAFAMEFEHQNPKTRLISCLNNARTFLTGISFGDQAQFFRKKSLEYTDGYPSMMLMEDVELSLRLKETGRTVFLSHGIVVSGRRWQGNGFAKSLKTVIFLFTRYLIERRFLGAGVKTQNYYRAYYTVREFD